MIWDLLQWLVYAWLGGALAFVAFGLACMTYDAAIWWRLRRERRGLYTEQAEAMSERRAE